MYVEGDADLRAYWADSNHVGGCSVCVASGRVLRIKFNYQELRVCAECGSALRELLIDALEDEE